MSAGKEIRKKIRSVGNTQKITSAMEMVAASKMRKTQEQMQKSRPYARQILRLATHLSEATAEDNKHQYLIPRKEVKRVGIIVVSSDRGLCGGLNHNLFKLVSESLGEWDAAGVEVDIVTIGSKANSFFARYGGNIVATSGLLGDAPKASELLGITRVMLDAYQEGKVDEVHVFTNHFVNTMTQKPTKSQLLPVEPDKLNLSEDEIEIENSMNWDYIYDPSPVELVDIVLDRYIEYSIWQAVVENIACEMAARMIAMKAASDNAADLIEELELVFNKARQAAITQEITEIVSGAAAIN